MLVLGDSLSAGYGIGRDESWPHLLESRISEKGYPHSVVNASISGETTSGGARRIGPLLNEHGPAVVVIALGANDGLRGFQVNETSRHLRKMIHMAREARAIVVLLKVRIPPNYGPRYTELFEGQFDDIAASEDIIYAPFMLERFAMNRNAFQADGLHPVAAVQDDIVDTLWPSIRDALDAAETEARLEAMAE